MTSQHDPHIMTAVDLEFYSWFEQVAFFPDDFRKDLISVGLESWRATHIARSDAVAKYHSLTRLWRDYCLADPESELSVAVLKVIAKYHANWTAIKCQSLKKA